MDTTARVTLEELNELPETDFVRLLGGLWESSPWVVAETARMRPFFSVESLFYGMSMVVFSSDPGKQLDLIRAHPDLAGKLAAAGQLTPESTGEQAAAGLNDLTDHERAVLADRNAAYRERFGFPFVICARENRKDAILKAFEERLPRDQPAEVATSLAEIRKIARLRLADLTGE